MRTLLIACGVAALVVGAAQTSRADEYTKLTYLTFSGPVAIPGRTLPAGTYRFELANPETTRRVVRISSQDGKTPYGLFLTMMNQQLDPAKDPVVWFGEAPAGAPRPVRAWFYPNERIGYEFVYPHDQALQIAKGTHQEVLATASNDAQSPSAKLERVNEQDRAQAVNESKAPASTASTNRPATTSSASANRPATTSSASANRPAKTSSAAQSNSADTSRSRSNPVATSGASPSPSANAQAGASTSTAQTPRTTLPRTASMLPLAGLLSALSLAAGFAVRRYRLARA